MQPPNLIIYQLSNRIQSQHDAFIARLLYKKSTFFIVFLLENDLSVFCLLNQIFESVFVLPKLFGSSALCSINVRGKLYLEVNKADF